MNVNIVNKYIAKASLGKREQNNGYYFLSDVHQSHPSFLHLLLTRGTGGRTNLPDEISLPNVSAHHPE